MGSGTKLEGFGGRGVVGSWRKWRRVKQWHEAELRGSREAGGINTGSSEHQKLGKQQKTQAQANTGVWKGAGSSWPLSCGVCGSLIRSALESW